MCLLIAQNPNTVFTLNDFEDFVRKNPDGFGMAVPSGEAGVKVFKLTPETKRIVTAAPEAINDHTPTVPVFSRGSYRDFDSMDDYWDSQLSHLGGTTTVKPNLTAFAKECFELWEREAKGKLASLHFRYRTHGDICDENTHPYKVLSKADGDPVDIWFMHNGTFSSGNHFDHTKSDTWHMATYFLRPILLGNPELINDEKLMAYFAHFIGSNRVTLITASSVKVLNKDKWSTQKVYDALLSNDYAWTKPYVAPPKPSFPAAQTNAPTKGQTTGGAGSKQNNSNGKNGHATAGTGKATELPSVSCWRNVSYVKGTDGKEWDFTKRLTLQEMNSLLFQDYKGFVAACKRCLTEQAQDVVLAALSSSSKNYSERSRAVFALTQLVVNGDKLAMRYLINDARAGKLECIPKAA